MLAVPDLRNFRPSDLREFKMTRNSYAGSASPRTGGRGWGRQPVGHQLRRSLTGGVPGGEDDVLLTGVHVGHRQALHRTHGNCSFPDGLARFLVISTEHRLS